MSRQLKVFVERPEGNPRRAEAKARRAQRAVDLLGERQIKWLDGGDPDSVYSITLDGGDPDDEYPVMVGVTAGGV
jgi:hypothetical protein